LILIVDGNGLAHLCYHALKNQEGFRGIDTVELFLGKLERLHDWLKMISAKHADGEAWPMVVFDSDRDSFRTRLMPEYKQNRTRDLIAQRCVWYCQEAVEGSADWSYKVSPDGFEADDTIADDARMARENVVIHSPDKDFHQCLIEGRVGIVKRSHAAGAFGNECAVETFTHKDFVQRYGFEPSRFVDYQALVGDTADNVKGLHYCGDKGARKIISGCDRLEDYDPAKLSKRMRVGWDSWLDRLPVLREVLRLGVRKIECLE